MFIGILNVTPDSFSDGGRYLAADEARAHAARLVASGAGMLDIGAESTRPGAQAVDPDEEWRRLEPVLEALRAAFPRVPLSLDTRHAGTARKGLEAGVAVLNDVTGFADPAMLDLAKASGCGLIAMRSRSRDGRLWMPPYGASGAEEGDPVADLRELRDRLALRAGIPPWRILLDPGFGFGTTYEGDRALWEALPALPERLPWPVRRFCIGISRKRFLAWSAGTPDLPADRRDGLTEAAHRQAEAAGYRVFRTHAVPPGPTAAFPDSPRPLTLDP